LSGISRPFDAQSEKNFPSTSSTIGRVAACEVRQHDRRVIAVDRREVHVNLRVLALEGGDQAAHDRCFDGT